MRAAFLSATGGSAPATLGFSAVAPEWPTYGAAVAAPSIPAPESTLGSHPCVALSSAQVLPEWTTSTSPCNDLSANGDNPLNFLSHSRGSPHMVSGMSSLDLSDAAGKGRATLGVIADGGPVLTLMDAMENDRVFLDVEPNGRPRLELYDAKVKKRARLSLSSDGSPSMKLYDAAENTIWKAP